MKPWLVVALTVAGDQLTKFLVSSFLRPAQSVPLIPSVVHLTYVQNTGAAFGLFRGYPGAFALLSIGVAGWILLELRRSHVHHRRAPLELALILGGAIGNVIDRLRVGYVIDFLDLRVWPVFNVADSCITIGVGLLLWRTLVSKR